MTMLKLFVRDRRGASAVEFAMLLPVLLALLLGSVTVFDIFRTSQAAEKATFTVGDMLSRNKLGLREADLNLMISFVENTVEHLGSATLRVSSISNVRGKLEVNWTKAVGNDRLSIPAVSMDGIPLVAQGDSVILTETFVPHRAFVPVGSLDQFVYHKRAVHRPRFVGKIDFR